MSIKSRGPFSGMTLTGPDAKRFLQHVAEDKPSQAAKATREILGLPDMPECELTPEVQADVDASREWRKSHPATGTDVEALARALDAGCSADPNSVEDQELNSLADARADQPVVNIKLDEL